MVTATGEKIELKTKGEHKRESPKPSGGADKTSATLVAPVARKPLTEEEKQQRLHEMQQNANWHESQQNIKRQHIKERSEREQAEEKTTEFDRNYIHKEMNKALSKEDSLEARLKSNKNNIQRKSSSMHSHFTKK